MYVRVVLWGVAGCAVEQDRHGKTSPDVIKLSGISRIKELSSLGLDVVVQRRVAKGAHNDSVPNKPKGST
ncbi:hypothetical protein J6590_101507 [Homalodisca vitripennis]|nr:hypothetical protein J6590_101507 [Homalodisca vitripennis]